MIPPWEDPRVVAGLARQFQTRRETLDGGARHVGWKVGFGAPAALDRMQISAPLLGYLTDATVSESGVGLSAAGWTRGVVEFEVAVYLGADVAAGTAVAQAREAVAAVGPAIEIADIFLDRIEAAAVEDILAADIFHEGVIFGDRDERRAGLDVAGLHAEITIDGAAHATTDDLQAITGDYGWIVTVVADTLAANGERLNAGDVIITGSVIPPVPAEPGKTYRFELKPIPAISVRIT